MKARKGRSALGGLLMAAMVLSFDAGAVMKTYSQHGFTEVQNIEMDGLPSSSEITSTPQLAFPGVTLDDISHCTFISDLHGGTGDNVVKTRAKAWGIFPQKHMTDGCIDKLSLQFGVKEKDGDGDITKCVILFLTNGEGGVHVQKGAWCYKSGTCLRYRFNKLDGSGKFSFAGGDGNPDGGEIGTEGYKAWGIQLHGIGPTPTASLAFPGAKLANLTNYMFVAGYQIGNGIDNPYKDVIATYVTPWPSSGNVQKIMMQFTTGERQKTAIIELTERADGVYARQTHHTWDGTSNAQKFVIDESTGNVSIPSGTNGGASGGAGSYTVWELYGIPNYTYVPANAPMLLWTKKGGTLTLNDLVGAKFTALFGGAYVNSGDIKNLMGETLVSGLNTRETVDENGDITEIVTEFQYTESGKMVVVKFTNGADGVYAQALAARYNQTFGYVYSDVNGTYYGSSGTVATSRTAGGYGVCCLKAIADTAKIYRQGPTLSWGFISDTPMNSTMIPTSAQPGFSGQGMKLEDLSDRVYLSYMAGTSIGMPQYVLGKHTTIYPTSGDATKIVSQFTFGEGVWLKSCFLQFAYKVDDVISIQKIQKTWSTSGNTLTRYFTIGDDGTVTYQNGIGNNHNNDTDYSLYGLQIFPPFVKTSPMLMFKGVTLNDIENATFTGIMGGGYISATPNRSEGYNKRVIKDGDDVMFILVEFQCGSNGSDIKTVVVEFTNGEGGVYGTAKAARYVSGGNLGYQFVESYDGSSIAYRGNSISVVAVDHSGGYGVYDVQAAVEPDANEWVLDQNRNWSYYTGGEPIDDDAAAIRVKVTGNGATLTIDENATVGKIVFVNEAGVPVSTNAVVVGSGARVNFGEIDVGANAYVSLPTSLGTAATTLGSGATIAYAGDGTVSGVLTGEGAVEVQSGRVTFSVHNSFTGGLVVKSGAVAVAGADVGRDAAVGPFGAIAPNNVNRGFVTVEAGGMVDLNGKNGLGYRFTLAGTGVATGGNATPGPIVNFGSALDLGRLNGNSEAWTTGHALGYALASDVTLGFVGGDVGVVTESNYETPKYGCSLNLGSHTLTKTGAGTLWLWSNGLTVSGSGTLNVAEGVVDIRKGNYNGSASTIAVGADGTLRIGAAVTAAGIVNNGRIEVTRFPVLSKTVSITGAYSGTGTLAVLSDGTLTLSADLSVYNFVNGGTVSGAGTLTVNGVLTAGKAIPNLALADGATIKLTGTNAAQRVTGTFAASGRVNVDSSAISDEDLKAAEMVPVLSAPSLPADIKQRISIPGSRKRSVRVLTEGGVSTVYMMPSQGFTIFVK